MFVLTVDDLQDGEDARGREFIASAAKKARLE